MKENKVKFSGISKFRSPGSYESRKKSWRLVFIFFAIALVFAIIGIVDINVNASESVVNGPLIEEQYLNVDYCLYNPNTEWTTYGTWNFGVPEYRVAFFYGECNSGFITSDDPNLIGKGYTLYVDDSNCSGAYYWKATLKTTSYDSDGDEYSSSTDDSAGQYCHTDDYQEGSQWCDSGFWHNGLFFEEVNIDTNVPVFKDFVAMQNYLSTGTYNKDDVKVEIDYDNLPVDSSLPLIENVLANKISNKTGVNSGGHSVSAVKEFYDYITWKNTGNYDIQVERYPIVKLYEGTFSPKFLEDFEGDFYLMEILSAGNSSFTYQVDLPYIESNYPNDYSFLGKITTDVAGFWDTCELYYGYRLRYVDGANNKASCWTYVIPEQSNIKWDYIEYPYYSYVEYVDGSLSDNSDATGSSGEYDSLDDIDNAKNELDNENAFKDKYDILVGDVGTQEATNWLYSVVSFIKSTPSLVGSTLGFLPTPIRSGVFVVIFLGVIGSGLAIVRALI